MAEPDLTLDYDDLRESIAFELGYGRTSGSWSSDHVATINDMLDRGLRIFYSPPALPGEKESHRWSFVNILGVMDLVGDVQVYRLPDNFGGMSRVMTFESNEGWYELTQVDEEMIRINEQLVSASSTPHWFAVRPVNDFDPAVGQRHELVIYPEPDQAYRVKYRYRCRPGKLSSTKIYHHGHGLHSDTLQAACLACCEQFVEDTMGVRMQNFLAHLQKSISIDKELEASYRGYNGDGSDRGGVSSDGLHAELRARRGGSFSVNGSELF